MACSAFLTTLLVAPTQAPGLLRLGSFNTASGVNALLDNTIANNNTATGLQALQGNTTGNANVAIGANALVGNTTGGSNTAIGNGALFDNTTGDSNTALGVSAGLSVTTATNVICIGTEGANVNNSCFIGNIYSDVQPIVGMDPDSVTITSTGRLGRGNVSSRRYKHNIKPIAEASEVLYALEPISFRFNKEYDPTQTLAFGLIAEDVAKVNPDLIVRDKSGERYTVRYDAVNAMLLNEFLQRTSQSGGTRSDHSQTAKADRSAQLWLGQGERPARHSESAAPYRRRT